MKKSLVVVVLFTIGLATESMASWLKMDFTAKIYESTMHMHPVGKTIHGEMFYRTGDCITLSYLSKRVGKTAITQFDDLISYIHIDGFEDDGHDFWNRITQNKYMPGVGDKIEYWLNEYIVRDTGNINREIFITFEGSNLLQNVRDLVNNIPLVNTTKAHVYLSRYNQRSLPYMVKQEFFAHIQEMTITQLRAPSFIHHLLLRD